jgi:hypothetical protein
VALVNEFVELKKKQNGVHGVVDCTYTIFEEEGRRYLQLDTYGSSSRQIPNKVSQSIQLHDTSARNLKLLLERTFGV